MDKKQLNSADAIFSVFEKKTANTNELFILQEQLIKNLTKQNNMLELENKRLNSKIEEIIIMNERLDDACKKQQDLLDKLMAK